MVPTKVPKEPKPLSSASANPWDTLPREVQVNIGKLGQEGWRDQGESRGWAGPTHNL